MTICAVATIAPTGLFSAKISKDMFGLSIVSTKEIQALKNEIKGFYDDMSTNAGNVYLSAIAGCTKGLELPPLTPLSRMAIRELYETSAPVQGVVNYIARNVGEVMQYLLLTKKSDDQPVENHWIIDLLAKPNDRFTLRKFGTAWAINKLLYGDAWVYAPKAVGKDLGVIKSMYLIPSWRIGAEWGETSILEGVKLQGLSGDQTIGYDNVFESFDYNLDDQSAFGTSRLASAFMYLSMMQNGIRREDTALKNGGVTNIITPPQDKLTGITRPSEGDAIEKEFNSQANVGKTKVLRYPVTVQSLGNAPVDLKILESHKEAITALCFAYNIPVDLYYGQSKYENAKEAKKTIYEMNAVPMANEFAEDLLSYCGLSREFSLEVDTQRIDVLQDKPADTLDALDKMNASVNEKREVMGYEPIEEPWADQPMIPVGVQFGNEGAVFDINETGGNA